MGENRTAQERLVKQLVSTFRCHVCRRGYEREHVRVTARDELLWIVSVRCAQCRNQQVFWIALKDAEAGNDARDTSESEDLRFEGLGPVQGDDVLDMHAFLQAFNGDFNALFEG
ncbi:MAG: hypothetical protein ACRDFX_14125 [Chloroflexota bacterium]